MIIKNYIFKIILNYLFIIIYLSFIISDFYNLKFGFFVKYLKIKALYFIIILILILFNIIMPSSML